MYDLTQDYPAITSALRDACQQFAKRVDHYGGVADDAVREISAKSYDGFIAHTNGGFRVCVPCDLSTVESEGLTEFESAILQPYIDRAHIDAADWFVENHDTLSTLWELYQESNGEMSALEWFEKRIGDAEDLHAAQPDMFGAPAFWQTEAGHHLEEYHDAVSDWMREGGTFFYELRAIYYGKDHRRNATGADEIYIFAGINTDFEYGREKGLETAIERDYKIERLTPARIAAIVEHFGAKL
jgi:hypothetical protein